MKNLKIIFSSLLLLLGIFQLSHAANSESADLPVYQETVGEVSLAYNDAKLNGKIVLSSGLIMLINDYNIRNDNVMNAWQPNDVLAFAAHVKNDSLILTAKRIHNPTTDEVEPYLVFDVINSPREAGHMITEIKENGKYIVLNDNSVWEFSWYQAFATKYWNVNDRLLINGPVDNNNYSFVNLDAPVQHNATSANGTFVINAIN